MVDMVLYSKIKSRTIKMISTFMKLRILLSKIYHSINYLLYKLDLSIKAKVKCRNGVTSKKYCKEDIIVSLTSYGERLDQVHVTIESIMNGTMLPNKIILWLAEDITDNLLPQKLKNLQSRGLEIRYYKDIRSYKKLIPTLISYPNDIGVTIDDDVIYRKDVIEKLYNSYMQDPNCIHAHRVRRIILDNCGYPISYNDWENVVPRGKKSYFNIFTGVGGVLYPPRSLHKDVMNETVFMDICKFADDIWFWAMAVKNGVKIKKVHSHSIYGNDLIMNPMVQQKSLSSININKNMCLNDIQLAAVDRYYDLFTYMKKCYKENE